MDNIKSDLRETGCEDMNWFRRGSNGDKLQNQISQAE
jgi:hypothetical protein